MTRKVLVWSFVAFLLMSAFAVRETLGIASPGRHPVVLGSTDAAAYPTAQIQAAPSVEGHHCADLLVQTLIQLGEVRGVWQCLEPRMQRLFKGSGDQALIGISPFFTGVRFIGCDDTVCVYALSFEATTAATTGLRETTMTVWLDGQGLVAHAAIPKAIP